MNGRAMGIQTLSLGSWNTEGMGGPSMDKRKSSINVAYAWSPEPHLRLVPLG